MNLMTEANLATTAQPKSSSAPREIPLSWVKSADFVSGGSSSGLARPTGHFAAVRKYLDIPFYIVVGFLIAAVVLPRLSPILPPGLRDFIYEPPAQTDGVELAPSSNDPTAAPSTPPEPSADSAINKPDATQKTNNQPIADEPTAQDTRPLATDLKQPPVAEFETDTKKIKRKKVSPRVRRRVKKLNKKAKGYLSKRRYKSAKRLLDKAISLDPYYASNYRYLGQALQKLRDPKGALKAYTTYLQLAPSSKYAPSIRKKVKKLNK